jgi:hypothetical protein
VNSHPLAPTTTKDSESIGLHKLPVRVPSESSCRVAMSGVSLPVGGQDPSVGCTNEVLLGPMQFGRSKKGQYVYWIIMPTPANETVAKLCGALHAARAWRRAFSLTDCIPAARFQHSPVHSPKCVRNSIMRRAGECCIRLRQLVAKTSYERIPTQTGRANVRANVGNL